MKLASLLLLGLCLLLGIGCSNFGERHPASDERVMFRPAGKRVLLGPEVAGVRLGMTEPQVLTEIHNHNLKAKMTFTACFDDYLALRRKIVHIGEPGRCLHSIDARYAGGNLQVLFSEDLPSEPGRVRASTVSLNDVANSAVSEVLRQLNVPNLTDGKRPWTVAMWCLDYWCMDMKRNLKERPAGRWLVIHRGAGLTLADNGMDSQPVLVEMLGKHGVTLEP